jgi:hypothetical protein
MEEIVVETLEDVMPDGLRNIFCESEGETCLG